MTFGIAAERDPPCGLSRGRSFARSRDAGGPPGFVLLAAEIAGIVYVRVQQRRADRGGSSASFVRWP